MNCQKCGREMLVSHIISEISENGGGNKAKKVYTCVNKDCTEHKKECRIKIMRKH